MKQGVEGKRRTTGRSNILRDTRIPRSAFPARNKAAHLSVFIRILTGVSFQYFRSKPANSTSQQLTRTEDDKIRSKFMFPAIDYRRQKYKKLATFAQTSTIMKQYLDLLHRIRTGRYEKKTVPERAPSACSDIRYASNLEEGYRFVDQKLHLKSIIHRISLWFLRGRCQRRVNICKKTRCQNLERMGEDEKRRFRTHHGYQWRSWRVARWQFISRASH